MSLIAVIAPFESNQRGIETRDGGKTRIFRVLFESNQSGIETFRNACRTAPANGLNRTRVELKRPSRARIICLVLSFESNQSGIETPVESVARSKKAMV